MTIQYGSIPMVSIRFNIFAVDPAGGRHSVSTGNCAGCPSVLPLATGYTCVQAPTGGTCAGAWQIGYEATFQVAPPNVFNIASGTCVAAGATSTCRTQIPAGTAPPFNRPPNLDIDLPDGTPMPELDERAIDDIRSTHFPSGENVDRTMGLFRAELTDTDLEEIFMTGMLDDAPFVENESFYLEKTFSFPNAGVRSPSSGGGVANRVTLVIGRLSPDVITMYPL